MQTQTGQQTCQLLPPMFSTIAGTFPELLPWPGVAVLSMPGHLQSGEGGKILTRSWQGVASMAGWALLAVPGLYLIHIESW